MQQWLFGLSVTVLLTLFLAVAHGIDEPPSASLSPRACVIGAGYSGLGAARYLKEYGANFTVFEATRHVGGTWRFDPHVGTDEDGLPVFSSMYKNLRTNTPRQTMEYPGFPLPDSTPAYPTGTCFYKYLKLFTKEFDLEKNIQLRSWIKSVKWAGGHWNLTYTRTDTRTNQTEACDFVIVATGEYRKEVWPKFPGQESFKGNMIHSHDYKEPEPYKKRRVLVLGGGASGIDVAMHLTNVSARLVHSHHVDYSQQNFGPNYIRKPDIKEFTSNGVLFQDDSFEELDDVIFCTGYNYDIPYLDKSCGITKTGKYILPLYQHMVNIRHPTMLFIGYPKGVINRVLDAQGQYAAKLVTNQFKLPSQEEMLQSWLRHVRALKDHNMKIVHVNTIGDQMDQYFANLTSEAGVTRAPPVLSDIRDFNAKYRKEDTLNYRDFDYKITDDSHYTRWYNLRKGTPCPLDDLE